MPPLHDSIEPLNLFIAVFKPSVTKVKRGICGAVEDFGEDFQIVLEKSCKT